MDIAKALRAIAARIPNQLPHIRTEEAAKNAFVMPFIGALGYDVFDPTEVTPEMVADVGTKKGEKVDYAILSNGRPIILFECKAIGSKLEVEQASQLYRYFSVTPVRVGILTDGIRYRFFSDLDEPNKMDSRPFFEVDLGDLSDSALVELGRFAKGFFDEEKIVANAQDLKWTREIRKLVSSELANPSEELVRLFTSQVYGGRLTRRILDQFTELTRVAFAQHIREKVRESLQTALSDTQAEPPVPAPAPDPVPEESSAPGVETTEDEITGFYIVRAILSEVVSPGRIFMRDNKSYCAVLLDDNNRKTVCRLWFNTSQYYLGLFDQGKTERREALTGVEDIYRFAELLRVTCRAYLSG